MEYSYCNSTGDGDTDVKGWGGEGSDVLGRKVGNREEHVVQWPLG